MNYMLYSCKGITSLDFTSFNTLKCRSFVNMFGECNEINITITPENNENLINNAPEYIHFIEQIELQNIFS